MQIDFVGKRALVTGAGKGIGRDIVKELANCNAEVIALSRTESDLESLHKEVPSIKTLCLDVSDWNATRKAVEELGTIDLLVNNAGIARCVSALEASEEDYDMTMNINVKAVMNITQVIAKGLIKAGKPGSIVNISSVAANIAIQDHLTYSTSKGALNMMTKSFALELGSHSIRVNAVCPTVVWTDMAKENWPEEKAGPLRARIPQHKFVEVRDVVNPVLYLLSDKADMINGALLPIDGGLLCT